MKIFRKLVIIFLFLFPIISFSQNYRNINSYINDFNKNELYVKKAFMDYTKTIVNLQDKERSKSTANRIIEKLENVNYIY